MPTRRPAEPGLPVAAVARRLGVAPATLRTWALRYGLGPAAHVAGTHRRYGPEDLRRLEAMRRLTQEGVAPGDAARLALADGQTPPADPPAPSPRGGPGGRVLPLPGADEVTRGLGRAAMSLDARAVTAKVRRQLAQHGVLRTWTQVLQPVLVAAGDRWAATGEGVEVEHLLAECITVALREVAEQADEPPRGRPVLLACAPGEQHSLPLHALAAALAERGVGARTLGAALPADALDAAVRRTGPSLLFLWSQLPATADTSVLTGLPVLRPGTTVVVGGPGWSRRPVPDNVHVAVDLPDALALVLQALQR